MTYTPVVDIDPDTAHECSAEEPESHDEVKVLSLSGRGDLTEGPSPVIVRR